MSHDQEQGPVITEKVERDHPVKKKNHSNNNGHEVSRESLMSELKKDLEAGKPLTKPSKKKRKRRTKAEMEAAQAAATPPQSEAPKKKRRKRRTKAEMEAANAAHASKERVVPPTSSEEDTTSTKKRRRRKGERRGRVWPVQKISLYMVSDSKIIHSLEDIRTTKPTAMMATLEKVLKKTLKKFTVESSNEG